jgi:dTDP-4-amino-4,6-dideoxygalactose transaminase
MDVLKPRQVAHSVSIISPEMEAAVLEALGRDTYMLGDITKAFERDFAAYVGTTHAVAVSSGTAALHLALLAAGIGASDDVIMSANAYPPVADCIRLVGARPVLVDVDERTGCLDPSLVESAITDQTRAVIPLHMYGHPVDMDPLLEIAKTRNILVIEDGAHALGSTYKGRMIGSIGDIAIFSTGRKHITTGGIGGMVTTNRADLTERVRLFRNHGRSEQQQRDLRMLDNVEVLGYNYRQSELLAALGKEQLRHLPEWVEERRENAAHYRAKFAELNLPTQPLAELDWATHSYLHFPIVTDRRDDLAEYLTERGVETHFIYPVAVHKQHVHMGHVVVPPGGLPISERLAAQVLTLTVRPGLAVEDMDYICEQIRRFFQRN